MADAVPPPADTPSPYGRTLCGWCECALDARDGTCPNCRPSPAWWHRTLLPCVFFGLLIPFAVAMGVLSWLLNSRIAHWLGFSLAMCVFLGGCAYAPTPNGRGGVWGIGFGDTSELPASNLAAAAPQAGGIIGGIFGGPAGAAIGTGIGAVVAGAFGLQAAKNSRLKGQDEGWDERERAAQVQAPLVQAKGTKS